MADAEVCHWLRTSGLSRFVPRFEAAAVTKENFLELFPTDFDAFGVNSPSDRKRLNDLIADRRRAAGMPKRYIPPRASTSASLNRDREMMRIRENFKDMKVSAPPEQPKRKERARVSVCVRKRPLSGKEQGKGDKDIIRAEGDKRLTLYELKEKVDMTKYLETHDFNFDSVFAEDADNEDVYQGTAQPLVEALFTGGRSTCFAYGQTGAGKTFTMAGDGYEMPGLYTLAVHDLFARINERKEESQLAREQQAYYDDEYLEACGGVKSPRDDDEELEVWISFYEIYGTRLHDLLNNRAKLEAREDTNNDVKIVGLTERRCDAQEDVMRCIDEANASRSTGVTGANDDSSRSHAVFQIELREVMREKQSDSGAFREALLAGHGNVQQIRMSENAAVERGRLCFIDLAGSERGSDTRDNNKQTRTEGAEINKSLLALKECIRAMGQRKDHTPFRGSKLTQVLKASFVGKNCRTVMIANVSPASSNCEHTLNTLRYSDRVKEIRRSGGCGSASSSFSSRRSLSQSGRSLRVRRATLAAGAITAAAPSTETSPPPSVADFQPNPPGGRRATEKTVRGPPGTRAARTAQNRKSAGIGGSKVGSANSSPESGPLQNPKSSRSRLRRPSVAVLPPRAAAASALASLRRANAASDVPGGSRNASPPGGSSSGSGGEGGPRIRPVRRLQTPALAVPTETGPAPPEKISPAVRRSLRSIAQRTRRRPPVALTAPVAAPVPAPEPAPSRTSVLPEAPAFPEAPSLPGSPPILPETEPVESLPVVEKERPVSTGMLSAGEPDFFAGTETFGTDMLFQDAGPTGLTPDPSPRRPKSEPKDEPEPEPEPEREPEPEPVRYRTRSAARRLLEQRESSSVSTSAESGRDVMDVDSAPPVEKFSAIADKAETLVAETSRRMSKRMSNRSENGGSRISPALRDVVRHHHMQIEELMRLCEQDVQLVRTAETGEIDQSEYAMKLELNLSQKLDMVVSLKAKLCWLAPAPDLD